MNLSRIKIPENRGNELPMAKKGRLWLFSKPLRPGVDSTKNGENERITEVNT